MEYMTTEETDEFEDLSKLSPPELRLWLETEKEQLRILMERRLREVTAIVRRYEAGTQTWEQTDREMDEYRSRWPEPNLLVKDQEVASEIEDLAIKKVYNLRSIDDEDRGSGPAR
jgi:hypothetical protein